MGKKLDNVTKEHCVGFVSVKDILTDLLFEDPLFDMLNSRSRVQFDESETEDGQQLFDNLNKDFCMNLLKDTDNCPDNENDRHLMINNNKNVSTENDYILKTVLSTEFSGDNLDRNIKSTLTNEQRTVKKLADRYNAILKLYNSCKKDIDTVNATIDHAITLDANKIATFHPMTIKSDTKIPSLKTKIPRNEEDVKKTLDSFLDDIKTCTTYGIFQKRCIENYTDLKVTVPFIQKVLPTYVQCSLYSNDKKFNTCVNLWKEFFRFRKHAYSAALHLAAAKKMKDDKENGTNLKSIFSDFHSAGEDLKKKLNESINFRIAVSILSRNEFHLYWEAFNPDKPFPTISNTSVLLPGTANAAVISNVPRIQGVGYSADALNTLYNRITTLNNTYKKYQQSDFAVIKDVNDRRRAVFQKNKPSDDEIAKAINDLKRMEQSLHA